MASHRTYAEIEVGAVFPETPTVFDVTPEAVAAFRAATLDEPQDVDIGAPAPSMLAAVYLIEAIAARGSPPGGIHAKQSFHFLQPIAVGDRLRTQARIVDKYVRKDRPYVVATFETRNDTGEIVATGTITSIWGKDP